MIIFCLERLGDSFVPRVWVILFVLRGCVTCFGPEILGDFFCPERFGDFFCSESLGDFFCPERFGDIFCLERLSDFFVSREVG